MSVKPITELEARIAHRFQDSALIRVALTHSSAAAGYNYERLEFLGDRVLGLVIAELLYTRFPKEPEGDLAKRLAALVQGSFLAKISQELELGAYITLSDAEAQAGGAENDNILADIFESLIGALYLDGGFEKCQKLIHELWADRLDVMKEPPQHPKTQVQEWTQAQGLGLPEYRIVAQSGPDHAPVFDIELRVEGFDPIVAQGKSRQNAEKEAAREFMKQHKGEVS
ncbi:MAG: ribonuclease III [Rhodospirillales bacterium]|nr:ribonuclease III [Alphaproteobacteria bacterium]MCB9981842.1 ribonuclease III [Rhodospirillales bacterium]